MTLYRKFGQGLAVLCCVTMFVLAIAYIFAGGGISTVDEESGDIIYFYERSDFQGALLVALAFLVSATANAFAQDCPWIAACISLLPLVMTFYEMAVGNLNFIAAAVVLLLALIHFASNAIAWYDMYQVRKQEKAKVEEAPVPEAEK